MAASAALAPASLTKSLGAGDGVAGPSALCLLLGDFLRESIRDLGLAQDAHRRCVFAILATVRALAAFPPLSSALLYTPQSTDSGTSSAASRAATQDFRPWRPGPSLLSASTRTALPPPQSLAGILAGLRKQASVYTRNSQAMAGDAEVLVGSTADDAEFTAVLCLARDVEVAAEHIDAGLRRWAAGPDAAALSAAAATEPGARAAGTAAATAVAAASRSKLSALEKAAEDTPQRHALLFAPALLLDDPTQARRAEHAGLGVLINSDRSLLLCSRMASALAASPTAPPRRSSPSMSTSCATRPSASSLACAGRTTRP